MAVEDNYGWLEDFSFVLEPATLRQLRKDPDFAAFTGSKWLALPWLTLVSTLSGALGGIAVSGWLWSEWQRLLAFPFVFTAFFIAVLWLTMRISGKVISGLAGYCIFFGTLIGVFTMWAAQTESAGWAYAIAGGLVFFLLGITGAQWPPPNSKHNEEWFLTGAVAAPIGACLAAWLYRNQLLGPPTASSAGLAGGIASFIFLGVTMTLYLYAWRPGRGLLGLANLCLHTDKTAAEAARLFGAAIKADTPSAVLHARRGLALALAGNESGAEADWTAARTLEPERFWENIGRGWLALRRRNPALAATQFAAATKVRAGDIRGKVGLGLAHLRTGDPASAVAELNGIPPEDHIALSLTYLAEAHLAAGDASAALEAATVAIDEWDSFHGRSWVARADAHRALGRIDEAAEDYNEAWWHNDELGIERRALAGLEAIDRPLTKEEPDCSRP